MKIEMFEPREVTVEFVVGESAFDIAVRRGFVGTEQEWVDSIGEGGSGGAPVIGDTGPLRLTNADMGTGWTVNDTDIDYMTLAVHRVGNTVFLGGALLAGEDAGALAFQLAEGFMPSRVQVIPTYTVSYDTGLLVAGAVFTVYDHGQVHVLSSGKPALHIIPPTSFATDDIFPD